MKRTVIKYVVMPDNRVKITGIENVASLTDIAKEFGGIVKRYYGSKYPWYGKSEEGPVLFPVVGQHVLINVEDTFEKSEFSKIIQTMKAAGDRLQQIKKQVSESEEKTIII